MRFDARKNPTTDEEELDQLQELIQRSPFEAGREIARRLIADEQADDQAEDPR